MPPAITCPVKCRAHHRLSPRPPPPPAPEPLARCRSPPGLAFALAAEPGGAVPEPPPVAGDGGLATTAALLAGGQSRHGIFHEKLVKKAFFTAEAAHCGQMRASGYPYLQHCVETAALLSEIGAGPAVVAAGLLHDTVDDACLDYGFISEQFGADLADLVEGVSKLSHLSKLARRNGTARRTDEADRLHTIFLAMEDAGAVLIKLADRLDNMRTLDSLPKIKQQGFAKETLEIFTPLANRLGILSWKEQLENLCFKYLYPEHFEELSSDLLEFYNRDMIAAAIRRLEQALQVRGLSYHAISGRHKSLCNIYSKMVRKKLAMDEIYDIHGVRVILGNKVDCFTALEVVHRLWPRLPGKFKDYISSPKPNGYQSLHTVILSEDTLPLEIQIRTRDMHLRAEFGIAAYWIYKEGNYLSATRQEGQQHAPFLLTLMTVLSLKFSYTKQCDHSGPILVILLENEKMSAQELPQNSTVSDLLERASGCYSKLRPRLNNKIVHNLNQDLKMGDVIELIPPIPCKSLIGYRRELQEMLGRRLTVSQP